jgi:membrane-associated phospholipid phosphatase
MEPTNKPKISAKDLFINLGAFVALYTVVFSLINLLFTVINKAYPQVNAYYSSSANISWPVSIIIIFFPILVLMYWLLEKQYVLEPDRQRYGVHKWLSYITLFLSGFGFAGDLVAVLYYFLNGEELTTGFPSSHVMFYTVFFGMLIFLSGKKDWLIKVISAFFIITIGASRLYLGMHSLSDVIAGYVFGLLYLVVICVNGQKLGNENKEKSHNSDKRNHQNIGRR